MRKNSLERQERNNPPSGDVIEIPTATVSRPAVGKVTQRDLAEVAELRRRKREIEAALKQKRCHIKFAVENGAEIEPGLRSVRRRTVIRIS
jgi:hypothetical protein